MDSADSNTTVVVVDADCMAIDRLRCVLQPAGFVVEAYESAEAFLGNCDPSRADCLIIEAELPGMSGFELQERLLARGRRCPVVFVDGRADLPAVVEAIRKGASDYLEKPVKQSNLLAAVREAIDAGRRRRRLDQEHSVLKSRLQRLTEREREVMHLLCDCKSGKQIAYRLGISAKTAWRHCSRVLDKLELKNEIELVRLSINHPFLRTWPSCEE